MIRIMFDTNAFDKMNSLHEDVEKITNSSKYEYYITSVQIEEIGNIPDNKKDKRLHNLLVLCQIRAHLLFAPAVVGHARVGYCAVTGSDDIYSDLLNESRNNVHDAMIGSTAKREHCTIVTDDKDFTNKLRKHSIPTMTYDEFICTL